jgi:hypothetical protein
MLTNKRFVGYLPILCVAALLLVPLASCNRTSSGDSKTVESAWEVSETTRLSQLTIAGTASVIAPEGCQVTMTVDHVETPILPGTYTGDIVLTPTVDIPSKALMHGGTYSLRPAPR